LKLSLSILCLAALSFLISFFATLAMKQVAPLIGFVDKPGGRKIHANPKPLGGGVAIFLGFCLPVLAGLAIIHFHSPPGNPLLAAYWSGGRDRTPVAFEMIGAALIIHVLGLWDDRKALGPYLKLVTQLAVIT
jgi:UDP-GlcNAc:undecaprenyl-phosphate GlcNAc-1-phosphate transferase